MYPEELFDLLLKMEEEEKTPGSLFYIVVR